MIKTPISPVPADLLRLTLLLTVLHNIGCASPPDVRTPRPELVLSAAERDALSASASLVLENRCVVCHGCYDAPCQLKLGTFEGIERGASKAQVYGGSRLVAADPTRLGIDAHGRAAWRQKDFHPVLPEGEQSDPRASLLLRMLELKRQHPLSSQVDIGKEFSLDLDREQTCTDQAHFDDYAKQHPLWGMPYAVAGLTAADEATLIEWVRAGAPLREPRPLSKASSAAVEQWETFLNQPSLKGQLVARYIYEHLFLASLRFEDPASNRASSSAAEPTLFRLLRSKTLKGPISEIATRRPFEDPGVPRVFYRFERRLERPLDKTLMPYALSDERLNHFKKLFFEPAYEVQRLPSYEAEVAANPFLAFEALPIRARYRFMLEEAQYTLMGFIKGPVCRGQVALNVIQDRFWVYFIAPDAPWLAAEASFLSGVKSELDMPAESGSNALPLAWFRYATAQERYLDKKAEFFAHEAQAGKGITPAAIWDGDGENSNAALTVFRHFDSATVVQGLVGAPPKTAWVIDYPVLERIHYLLVAGFDVFGNTAHQVSTRLNMDFLRMEAEAGFLMLLPPERRQTLAEWWYQGVDGDVMQRTRRQLVGRTGKPNIVYQSAKPELEAFSWLEQRVSPALSSRSVPTQPQATNLRPLLERLGRVRGRAASFLPETSFVALKDKQSEDKPLKNKQYQNKQYSGLSYFTLLRDSAHSNVAQLFQETERRQPDADALVALPQLLGSYPNALFLVEQADSDAFVEAIEQLDSEQSYIALRARFGVLRASDQFWDYSDQLNQAHQQAAPIENGLLDYNRLEAY